MTGEEVLVRAGGELAQRYTDAVDRLELLADAAERHLTACGSHARSDLLAEVRRARAYSSDQEGDRGGA